MGVYEIKKCPKCGKAYQFNRNGMGGYYGSPLVTCYHCGTVFIDTDVIELAIQGPRKADLRKFSPIWLIGVFMGALMIAISISSGEIDLNCIVGAIIAALCIAFIISEVKNHDKHLAELDKEMKASEARLSNKQYAETLKNAGYSVPEKYLI